MLNNQIYDELLKAAYLAEENNLPQAAKWLHSFIVGAHPTPTLAMFEANINGGTLEIQCLDTNGIFVPFWGIELKSALKDRYRFPPLFRVMQAGHKSSS
ncbi:MAG: hypothetical protein ILNGONEN_00781 [Syntrophorhabdaceae bacterium]|nr:hypothetical protein [Syntrophorhabdaceae bacterium]